MTPDNLVVSLSFTFPELKILKGSFHAHLQSFRSREVRVGVRIAEKTCPAHRETGWTCCSAASEVVASRLNRP